MTTINADQEMRRNASSHPISMAIDQYIHSIKDIKFAAKLYMPIAQGVSRERKKDLLEDLRNTAQLLESEDRKTQVLARKEADRLLRRFIRMRNSDVPRKIENGLYLSLFASFDAFIGQLLKALYTCKSELFSQIKHDTSFDKILKAQSIDEIKNQVLEDEIESIRRESYTKQFELLGSRFAIELKAFESWPLFIERSQRRNLLTHCDGIVSEQYISVCQNAGVDTSQLDAVGTQVGLGPEYFFESCEILIEVGLKLGHTLWRKLLPSELDLADTHLMGELYSALEASNWARAEMIGSFAYQQKKISNDYRRKTIVVNYSQALKRSGNIEKANQLLKDIDWSATSIEFKLADLVLRERWDEAAALMREIGANDSLLSEESYHLWPLFLEFRETEQFSQAYHEIFSHSYSEKLGERIESVEASLGLTGEADADGDGSQYECESSISILPPATSAVEDTGEDSSRSN